MEKVYSVGQVNKYIKRLISNDYALSRIAIKGELSNVKYHSSGHVYFSLKDSTGAIPCMLFASNRMNGLHFTMQDGQSVVVQGNVGVYERDGRYQLYATTVSLAGAGELYQRFEQLKVQLEAEGLFDFEHKKPIPAFATRVGIVTASTGAAVQDIISIANRRNPYVQLYLYSAKVQGEGAAATIIKGIRTLDQMNLDTIIIGRGGGSIEDLWAFNEEALAYAIYEAKTPIISGTGHETDTTIADYVADKRAATPSAACELAVFEWNALEEELQKRQIQLRRLLNAKLQETKSRISYLRLQLDGVSPKAQLRNQRQYVDSLQEQLKNLIDEKIVDKKEQLSKLREKAPVLLQSKLDKRRHKVEILTVRLNGLSPTAKLVHGFGYVTMAGRPVKDISGLKQGDNITITMKKGSREAQIIDEIK